MFKILKKTVAVIILLIFASFLWLAFQRGMGDPFPTILGYGYAKVVSGSMEPTIHVGELVIVNTEVPVQEGDVIMYLDENNRLITHRVIQQEEHLLVTKGDANEFADAPITSEQVVGKIICHFPSVLAGLKANALYYFLGVLMLLLVAASLVRWAFRTLTYSPK